jgi:hypothetical protein
MDKNQQAALMDELFQLTAYMITSARGLYDEPADYGMFRMLDSSGRLLAIMETYGMLDPFLVDLKEIIDEEREGNMDSEGQRERLDKAIIDIAKEMQTRLT